MKIPEKELVKFGFRKYDSTTNPNPCPYFYERNDGMLIEDVNQDGSVDLKYLLDAYESMGETNGFDRAQKQAKEAIDNLRLNQ